MHLNSGLGSIESPWNLNRFNGFSKLSGFFFSFPFPFHFPSSHFLPLLLLFLELLSSPSELEIHLLQIWVLSVAEDSLLLVQNVNPIGEKKRREENDRVDGCWCSNCIWRLYLWNFLVRDRKFPTSRRKTKSGFFSTVNYG